MILPQTYHAVLLTMILGLLCLGSWASLYKAAGKWRFELFYFDFVFGLMIAAVVAAFTLGSMGYDGFSVMDDFVHAGKRQWMFGFLAGVVFNLGNMLLMGCVSVAGLAVAFPVGMGLSVVGAILIGKMGGAGVNGGKLAIAAVLLVATIVFAGLAYGAVMRVRRAELLAQDKKRASRGATATKGMVLAIISGLIIAGMYPLLGMATPAEVGLGPFSLALLFGAGMFFSTIVFNIFFMNLPVQGEPIDPGDYFRAPAVKHLFGLAAGIVWCAGMLAIWTAGSAPAEAQLSRPVSFALSEGGIVLAGLWGLLLWREFRTAGGAGKMMGALAVLSIAAALAVLATALPVVGKG